MLYLNLLKSETDGGLRSDPGAAQEIGSVRKNADVIVDASADAPMAMN